MRMLRPDNVAHHLRGAAASDECVMLCDDRRFLPRPLPPYMYTWDLHHLGTRPFQVQRGNTYPGVGTNFIRFSIITFRTSASSTTRSSLPSTACSDLSESSRSERSFPHAATTCEGSRESGAPIRLHGRAMSEANDQPLSVATTISYGRAWPAAPGRPRPALFLQRVLSLPVLQPETNLTVR